jgi:hypothetical protein
VRRVIAVAFVLAFAAGAGAQEDRPAGGRPGPGRRPPREEIYRMVDSYVAEHLQESLALSDEQRNRVLPLVQKLSAARRGFAERRVRALMQMRRAIGDGTATDARMAELLQQLKAAEAEEPAAIRAAQDAIDAQLTPLQQARFRVLEAEVEHRMRRVMSGMHGQRGGRPGAPPPDGDPRHDPQ